MISAALGSRVPSANRGRSSLTKSICLNQFRAHVEQYLTLVGVRYTCTRPTCRAKSRIPPAAVAERSRYGTHENDHHYARAIGDLLELGSNGQCSRSPAVDRAGGSPGGLRSAAR